MDSLLPLALLLAVLVVLVVLLRWARRQREQEQTFAPLPAHGTPTEAPASPPLSVGLEEPAAEAAEFAEEEEEEEEPVSPPRYEPEPAVDREDLAEETQEAVAVQAPVSPPPAASLIPELDIIPAPPASEPARVVEVPEEVHRKARRLARVLVQEIKMYHAAKVEQARSKGTLLTALAKEIEQGKTVYNSRTPREILESRNYFEEALVEILAEGDEGLLR